MTQAAAAFPGVPLITATSDQTTSLTLDTAQFEALDQRLNDIRPTPLRYP